MGVLVEEHDIWSPDLIGVDAQSEFKRAELRWIPGQLIVDPQLHNHVTVSQYR